MISQEKALLIGDNPFHGISHLSQEAGLEGIRQHRLNTPPNWYRLPLKMGRMASCFQLAIQRFQF
jgi:hypothetical protein